jgi:hypothetical protein
MEEYFLVDNDGVSVRWLKMKIIKLKKILNVF